MHRQQVSVQHRGAAAAEWQLQTRALLRDAAHVFGKHLAQRLLDGGQAFGNVLHGVANRGCGGWRDGVWLAGDHAMLILLAHGVPAGNLHHEPESIGQCRVQWFAAGVGGFVGVIG